MVQVGSDNFFEIGTKWTTVFDDQSEWRRWKPSSDINPWAESSYPERASVRSDLTACETDGDLYDAMSSALGCPSTGCLPTLPGFCQGQDQCLEVSLARLDTCPVLTLATVRLVLPSHNIFFVAFCNPAWSQLG